MTAADRIQRVRIYLRREDRWEGRALYEALLDELQRGGATGATVLHGLAGFGPRRRVRLAADARAEQIPLVIEWIDRIERVERVLPLIDRMLDDALITREDVQVHRAVLRARGPFTADRSVGDVMRRPPPQLLPTAPLSAALDTMQQQQIASVPISDPDGQLVGLLTMRDLGWRVGLRLDLATLAVLSQRERDDLLAGLIGRSIGDVMSSDPRTVIADTAIAQALVTMIEWGYSDVPVVERSGRLVGILGAREVLQAAVDQASAASEHVRDAEPPASVRLVMSAVPTTATLSQPLAQALHTLLGSADRRVLLVDAAGKLQAQLRAATALQGLEGEERARFLQALQQEHVPPPAGLPGQSRSVDELAEAAPTAIAPDASVLDAARRLLELGVERAPVLTEDGRLLGIITRGGLVRALLQQSE